MPDIHITKRALADALKSLMSEMPFDKITVTQICDRCSMNRKSFYYHFKDKYELVNWIFDTEILALIEQESLYSLQPHNHSLEQILQNHETFSSSTADYHAGLDLVCEYFYQNRHFYRAALQIHGQNSFTDHFRSFLQPILKYRLESLFQQYSQKPVKKQYLTFYVDILTDTFLIAMERWVKEKDAMPADEFVSMLFTLVYNASFALSQEYSLKTTNPNILKQDITC